MSDAAQPSVERGLSGLVLWVAALGVVGGLAIGAVAGGTGCAGDDGGTPLTPGPDAGTSEVAAADGASGGDAGKDAAVGDGAPNHDGGQADVSGADAGDATPGDAAAPDDVAADAGGVLADGVGADAADGVAGTDVGAPTDVGATDDGGTTDGAGATDEGGEVLASPCSSNQDCGSLDATGVAGVGAIVALSCDGATGQCYDPGGLCKPDVAACAVGASCGYDLLLGLGVCTCSLADVTPTCFPGQTCTLGPLTGVFGVAHCHVP